MSFIQDGLESIGETYREIDKKINGQRKALEKRTRQQLKGLRKKFPKRIRRFQREGTQWIQKRVNGAVGLLQLASKSDVDRIHRRLGEINRQLQEIEAAKKPKSRVGSGSKKGSAGSQLSDPRAGRGH